ncbi:MAG: isoleucine--tRNA ligase [Myxococcales bacterium]|nr:isoleucine--tRNA ligase [Myxococcales bacterium]
MAAFPPFKNDFSFVAAEHETLKLWADKDIFPRSVSQRQQPNAAADYVFYDGPPFATGLPHYGHLVASTIKDIVPRYWAMRGKHITRRFGWDTHGLPIEMEVEKELSLSGPTAIREYGVAKFNEACRSGVLRYTEEWRKTITRLGRWVDFDDDYKTMDLPFMETVWWVFGQLWEKGLVYQGVRVMPFSWRLSTPLSNFEANLDYRSVQDPSVTARLAIKDDADDASLLIWTTTPWTLPSNLAVAVGEDIDYVLAETEAGEKVYVAHDRMSSVLGKNAKELKVVKGKALVGKRYEPLFPYFENDETGAPRPNAFQVIASSHVTTENGTGLVHMAPAFGEDDFNACANINLAPVDPVDEEGRFDDSVSDYAGQNIKDADKAIIRRLKDEGKLFDQGTVQHSYPFCWRSGTPLIYKTVPVWFVKVEKLREQMQAHNAGIHWVPEAIGQKRFGNWLADARDWAISRNRFWGTPIPIWKCDDCDQTQCVSSVEELEKCVGSSVSDLHPHFVDKHQWPCENCGGTMSRIPEVFDCWFESGSMPYAQEHYPFENAERFERRFPAQFIAEGLDQTRGWFYTLLVLSTALFDKKPFENVVVNGMILAEDGSKMSKSKRNYPDPNEVLETIGADALRAYLINSPVVRGEPLRFTERGVREVVRTVMLPLSNAWSFFVQYANVDGFDPKKDLSRAPARHERPELDQWILSVLQSLVGEVNTQMEGYYLYKVVPPMVGFIDDLTNWYIRRSRRRFWKNAEDEAGQKDKLSAYATLYEVLVEFAKVLAPVLPFITESLYQNLVVSTGMASESTESIHLCDYPQVDTDAIQEELERMVALSREVVKMGRALREKHKLKTRQPLGAVVVASHDPVVRDALKSQEQIICEELNVKSLHLEEDASALATLKIKPNFKTLGRRMGKNMKQAAAEIAQLGTDDFKSLQAGASVTVCGEAIGLDDLIVAQEAKGDMVVETAGALTVALDTQLSTELVQEGLVREVISRLQKHRKDSGLEITDRVALNLRTPSQDLVDALNRFSTHIQEEVLAIQLNSELGDTALEANAETEVEGNKLWIGMEKQA